MEVNQDYYTQKLSITIEGQNKIFHEKLDLTNISPHTQPYPMISTTARVLDLIPLEEVNIWIASWRALLFRPESLEAHVMPYLEPPVLRVPEQSVSTPITPHSI